jgi:hypothetical protein
LENVCLVFGRKIFRHTLFVVSADNKSDTDKKLNKNKRKKPRCPVKIEEENEREREGEKGKDEDGCDVGQKCDLVVSGISAVFLDGSVTLSEHGNLGRTRTGTRSFSAIKTLYLYAVHLSWIDSGHAHN